MIIITRILEFSIELNRFDPYLGRKPFSADFFSSRSIRSKKFYTSSALILETNGPSNSSIYIFWLMAPFDFRRTIFFYSSSTPRTKGKIKSQKSHIENQFIEITKKMTRFWRENTEKSECSCQRKAHSC